MIAGKAEASTTPITTLRPTVHASPTCGSNRVNGAMPRMENQITCLRPMRSPSGPPIRVPAATAIRNTASRCVAVVIDRPKWWIR
ncbi:hypothetical protein RLIN73S_06208 [Rhodanobacter lindaniclasticus]